MPWSLQDQADRRSRAGRAAGAGKAVSKVAAGKKAAKLPFKRLHDLTCPVAVTRQGEFGHQMGRAVPLGQ